MNCTAVCVHVCSPVTFWMPESNFNETWNVYHGTWAHPNDVLGTYIMAPELILMTFFINPSHQSLSLYMYVCPPIVAMPRLGRHVPAALNTSNNRRVIGLSFLCCPYSIFYWNLGQPRTSLQLKLIGILTNNLYLTEYTTSIIKTKIHPLDHLVFLRLTSSYGFFRLSRLVILFTLRSLDASMLMWSWSLFSWDLANLAMIFVTVSVPRSRWRYILWACLYALDRCKARASQIRSRGNEEFLTVSSHQRKAVLYVFPELPVSFIPSSHYGVSDTFLRNIGHCVWSLKMAFFRCFMISLSSVLADHLST
jgi:hypothetical protein